MKRVYCFLGAPGCGKTVLLRKLERKLDLTAWHMSRFVEKLGELSPENRRRSVDGLLLEGFDELFLARLAVAEDPILFIDGFPRSFEQAEKLLQTASMFNWDLRLIELAFPFNHEVKLSMSRQRARNVSRNSGTDERALEEIRSFRKLERACREDLLVAEALRLTGVPFVRSDALKGSAKLGRSLLSEIEAILPRTRKAEGPPTRDKRPFRLTPRGRA